MSVILTYNVNGLRAAMRKDWMVWLQAVRPDVICLQEVKATPDQVDVAPLEAAGYHMHWFPAEKKGYSGVAIFSLQPPLKVEKGMGIESHDAEGRVLLATFEHFSVISAYFPSGASKPERQQVKMQFLADFDEYLQRIRPAHPKLVIAGDFNICHQPIDLHNPQRNLRSPGFLPEERAWLSRFLEGGFTDTFRHFNPEPHHYSWWSYRTNARSRNLGWRIDYQMVSEALNPHLKRSVMLPKAQHSDHCPVLLELDL